MPGGIPSTLRGRLAAGCPDPENGLGPSIHPELDGLVSPSGFPVLLFGDVRVAVWHGNEFCGCDLVCAGGDAVHGEGQPAGHLGDTAGAGGSTVWRGAD